ncbi:GMP synthase [glutamine-hydrolyzing] [Clostridia bacterium]|nr:GMP synthase [glutamine-hydrolyzing] [Clostridia bacterium]
MSGIGMDNTNTLNSELVLVLDFGGQYKELIARRVRSHGVYSEIRSGAITAEEIRALNPIGIIFTGGPNSVYDKTAMRCDPEIFNLGIPILGICYGMHLMCATLGGIVERALVSEYGRVEAEFSDVSPLFKRLPSRGNVLMSHTDKVSKLPKGFVTTAMTDDCVNAACENKERRFYALQFHPETELTDEGSRIILNFLVDVCHAKRDYKLDDYIEKQIDIAKKTVGKGRALLALSGGVDSSVCAALLSKALGERLSCVFVDHGFMRLDEGDQIERAFEGMSLNLVRVNAAERFLSKLSGVTEPEKKRKIIGAEFAAVFEEEAKRLGGAEFLAQGTIYPDVIESGGGTNADVIKSHHNVGGLPKGLSFTGVIEPLSGLFKDEVRVIGEKLGLPKNLVERPPFPGPGLAIRVIGEVTAPKLSILRHADAIFCEEIEKMRKGRPQQYFAVYTDTRSVGVKGDARSYDNVIALRAVLTSDFMTCEYAPIKHELLARVSNRITNEIKQVSRVVYDITSKPPATIEWE